VWVGGTGVSVVGGGGGGGVSVGGGKGVGVSVGMGVGMGNWSPAGCSLVGRTAKFCGVGVKVGQGVRVGMPADSAGSLPIVVLAESVPVKPQARLTTVRMAATANSVFLHG
jgi:hypothetical protein